MARMVLGVFSNRINAEDAINTLKDEGYNPRDISVVMKDISKGEYSADNTGSNIASNTLSGATTGGVIGALAGLLVGTGVIPGLGVLLIGGPIAAVFGLTGVAATTVSGAVTGILAGGLLGALTSLGVGNDEARVYEEHVKEGGILVVVPAKVGEENHVRSVLEDYNATQVRIFEQSEYEARQAKKGNYQTLVSDESKYYVSGTKGGETKNKPRKQKNKKS